ncbi:unnamed protein product, partial [Discosporangium mesarthrocarpum]
MLDVELGRKKSQNGIACLKSICTAYHRFFLHFFLSSSRHLGVRLRPSTPPEAQGPLCRNAPPHTPCISPALLCTLTHTHTPHQRCPPLTPRSEIFFPPHPCP